MRRHLVALVALAVIVVALLATAWLPFVNTEARWLGLPSVMVWTVAWVLAITPVLAFIEFSGRYDDSDRADADAYRPGRSTKPTERTPR